MRSYSACIFTFVVFSGLISGLPNINWPENKGLLSASSSISPLSHYRRRAFFGGRQLQPGVKCDGTFYKQARVEAVATKACKDALMLSGQVDSFLLSGHVATRNPLSSLFKKPQPVFPATHLFPDEKGIILTMTRITRGFFSFRRIGAFLRLAKRDYLIFANACRSVGIVRQISKTEFVICNGVNGDPSAYNALPPKTI